jgi:tartrate/fumarate subfamily iron-sulfur-dependent hydro-lyase alpha chain
MNDLVLTTSTVYEMMYKAMAMASTSLPSDIEDAFKKYIGEETNPIARLSLETLYKNCVVGAEKGNPICSDTGYPLYYVGLGDHVRVEGGFSSLYRESKKAVAQLTSENILRPNMADPFTYKNSGNNLGYYFPPVEIRFNESVNGVNIIAIPKGGGSEIFGTFYRMMYPADGQKGVLKFVLDCIQESTYAGKSCPPNIIGIGIGGTSDMSMKLAKEAAVLRPIGDRHPDGRVASLEIEILELIKNSGVGPMGLGGRHGVFDVHIEYAATHTSALPVAFNAQCSLTRRKMASFGADGKISYSDFPQWVYR